MVEVQYVFREDLDALVYLSYEGDVDLLGRYHVKENMTLEEAVQSTLGMVDTISRQLDLDFHKVSLDGEPIGYFITFPKCLYSFGVGMKWRTKEILTELWDKIREILPEDVVCILYKNNTRAISWLERCGFEQQENDFNDNSISMVL